MNRRDFSRAIAASLFLPRVAGAISDRLVQPATHPTPALREFEMRVLFQMSAADSSTLIDNPVASKLGVNRALFHSEDRGQPEKFRPYALPLEEWLAWVKERLRTRQADPVAKATEPVR